MNDSVRDLISDLDGLLHRAIETAPAGSDMERNIYHAHVKLHQLAAVLSDDPHIRASVRQDPVLPEDIPKNNQEKPVHPDDQSMWIQHPTVEDLRTQQDILRARFKPEMSGDDFVACCNAIDRLSRRIAALKHGDP